MIDKAAVYKHAKVEKSCILSGPSILYNGYFCDGIFNGGIFYNGSFYGGEFNHGIFRAGNFCEGIFNGGYFHGGHFNGGIFNSGTFYDGTFYQGLFNGGRFYGGRFHGGFFHGGIFRDGNFCKGHFYKGVFWGGEFHGGTWKQSPVFIQGTRDYVCESDNNHISCSCVRKPVEWWLENGETQAEKYRYTATQVKEYRAIFEFVIAQMKIKEQNKGKNQKGWATA